jgi:hypothetical protein
LFSLPNVARALVALAVCFLLNDCTTADWASSDAPVVASDPPAPDRTGKSYEECTRDAFDRAGDAEAQGFDVEVRNQVYDETLRDCLYWAKRE